VIDYSADSATRGFSLITQTEDQAPGGISVVIPVFNGGPDLGKCLAAISASSQPILECILVDDASTDGMVDSAAERHGVRVIRLEQQCGPAMARNHGVQAASGEVIFFTDADVLLHPDAIEKAASALQSDSELAAVFGCYDDQPANPSFISQYRNLFHHWVHQTGAREASTFWTGCGAIRRNIFIELGGFSQDFRRPSIEDIELGMRLRRSGYRICLLKDMLGKHMKQWKLWKMVRTDVFQRAIPWMMLVLRDGKLTNNLNLDYKSRAATLLAGLLGLSFLLLTVTGHATATLPTLIFLLAAAVCSGFSGHEYNHRGITAMATVLALLAPLVIYWLAPDPLALIPLGLTLAISSTHLVFYRYVSHKRNIAFAIAVIPMQVVFFLGCAVSIPLAFIRHHLGRGHTKTDRNTIQ
jgi:glycosyltransferase involved in cell wall biosynthesis